MMGKFLGFCFFVVGLAAVYLWGVRPMTDGQTATIGNNIAVTARNQSTPVAWTHDQADVAAVARSFLQGWQSATYPAMYDVLTSQAQGRITLAAFRARYTGVMAEATVQSIHTSLSTIHVVTPEATVNFSVDFTTTALGTFHQQNTMHLLLDRNHWAVDWYPALIFSKLEDPYVVHLVRTPATRGSILDRHGTPLAEDGQFETVGVVPQYVNDEPLLLTYLSKWLHMTPQAIKTLYTLSWAQPDYFMPITTITDQQLNEAPLGLQGVKDDGVELLATSGRVYPQGSVASILVGYVDRNTQHGVAGLEHTFDKQLSGQDGVELRVTNRAYTLTAAIIASKAAVPGREVRLTIDLPTQRAAERALGIRNGAAVALDPTNGEVLALASTPGYDPNRFEVGASTTKGIGPIRSMYPRATQGTYPSGSIFKIVTMAAGIEKGGYTADTLIDGPGVYYGLSKDHPLHDWLATGHGTITLQEALTQSCDTCFYQVAQKLDGIGSGVLPGFARAFGFGAPTGIDAVADVPGLVGDDAWKRKTYNDGWRTGDTVNLSIGQGYFLATPLQVSAMLAAVANNGTRLAPRLILSIGAPAQQHSKPQVLGTLPVQASTLQSILRGMVGVTTEDNGTATFVFRGFPWQVAGKTGTAQNPGGAPHAWFGAIAPATKPRIALAVVLDNGGEGSQVAGPVARSILQTYLSEVTPKGPSGPQQLIVPGT